MRDMSLRLSDDSLCSREPTHIDVPYLLILGQQLALYRDEMGQLFVENLWHKDLLMHLEYLDHVMLASHCHHQEPPRDAKPLLVDKSRFEIVELPLQKSFLHSLIVMPVIVYRLCKVIRRAKIVHSGIVGWSIPMGWVVTPLALVFRKHLVIIVESAPWRLQHGIAAGWKRRLRAGLQEFLGRWVLRNAELVICTQNEYRQSLLGPKQAQGFVIPASWIDEKDILSQDEADEIWEKKLSASDSRLKILFVGRLVPEKGLLVLLEAMRQLNTESLPILLDILGEGDLRIECESAASEFKGITAVNLLGTVLYGAPLFSLIRRYDAVVVPNISDEQPRIVFDAYSQAVPILASDTPGLRSCVKSGEVGLFAPPNDVPALSGLLRYAAEHRPELRQLGLRSLIYAHTMTHQEMHRQRATLLQVMIDKRKQAWRT
jgi:glycosyltransferase involved in cell wall biosynthesis